jgi:hypothetical protein
MRDRVRRSLAVAVLALGGSAAVRAQGLPAYNIDPASITVSGVSSGAYMAVQLHVAHSRTISGVASIAGGPYYCAEDTLAVALTRCMLPDFYDEPDPVRLGWITRMFEQDGRIDPLPGLRQDPVWIFSSAGDTVVKQRVSQRLVEYYAQFVDPDRIVHVDSIGGQHSMPTADYGFPCNYKGSSANAGDHFINDCDYDAAGELLLHLGRRLRTPAASAREAGIRSFSQSLFLERPADHGMGPTGYAYVPEACETGARCKLHVALHGCLQSAARIGEAFVRHAGYNRWAESNRIVVLYPQALASPQQGNGNGCWDWWGYDDAHYMWREGRQMAAIMRMIDRLASAATAQEPPPPPRGITVKLQLDRSIELRWPSSDDPRGVGYTVFRGDAEIGPFLQVGADLVAAPRISLAELGSGTHWFTVVAVTGSGLESVSAPAAVVSLPGL